MRKIEKCPACDGQLIDGATIALEEMVAGTRFRVTIAGRKCRGCGESFASGELVAKKELLIAERLLRRPASGEALKYARKALGLRAADLAEMLERDAATISRWETGRGAIDRAAWLFVLSFIMLRLRANVQSFPPKEEALGDESIDVSSTSTLPR